MAKAPKTPRGRNFNEAVNAMNTKMDEFNNSNPLKGKK